MSTMHGLDWLFALGVVFFSLSIWSIGANDCANSFATSVSSRSLTLIQAGILATICEFIGAMTLGQKVTGTIRHGVFSIEKFENSPGTLLMAMVVAEVGSSTWLTVCTAMGFPVSTTQSIVGALVGVAFAAKLDVTWAWKKHSLSQVAASWGIAPVIAAGMGALIFTSIRVLVHARADPMKWALRLLPFYYGLTAACLALFIVISGGHGLPKLDQLGAGKACAIVLGVFAGVAVLSAVFFVPYFWRKLVKEDRRLRFWHIPMGPMLWKDGYSLYWPGNPDTDVIPDYYQSDFSKEAELTDEELATPQGAVTAAESGEAEAQPSEKGAHKSSNKEIPQHEMATKHRKELDAVQNLPWAHPKRIYATVKLFFWYGITRDVIHHQSRGLEHIHRRAPVFENKVEHLWTTAQICSAMIMSVAHGGNDVSNAIGPFTTEYEVWINGKTMAKTGTPLWIKAIGGLGIGFGFWTFGYHIMRSLGNRITKHSPTRGFSMELGAAITVMMASQLGLPVSTTQCITGSILGVALVNMDLKSINWIQLVKIFFGWVLTLPCAGLVAGLIMAMALNAPQFNK